MKGFVQDLDGETKSIERIALSAALRDVRFLLELYRNDPRLKTPKVNARYLLEHNYDSLTRLAIIMIVSAWEIYIEETIASEFKYKVENSKTPNQVKNAFNSLAGLWCQKIVNDHKDKPKPDEFIKWTGDGWKELLKERLESEINRLNTPGSENIKKLSEKYLGENICESWVWDSVDSATAMQLLDNLIKLRGDLAHRSEGVFDKVTVSQEEVLSALDLVEKLALCTERALG